MDTTGGCSPAAPPLLLVRRAAAAREPDVVALLRDVPVDPLEVADLMRSHWVLVLCDLTLPPTAPPVAAAAFRLDQPAATAHLAGIAVRLHLRRRGLGHRLLTGALTWLRAEGFERVQALPPPAGAGASLLAAAGFTANHDDTAEADASSRFVVLL